MHVNKTLSNRKGNINIKLHVFIPKNLTPKIKSLLEEAREDLARPKSSSIKDRILSWFKS